MQRQMLARNNKKRARGVPKASTVGIYASVFTLIVAVVAIGYRAPQQSTTVANATPLSAQNNQVDQTSVNEVVASNIAASLAETVNLSVAPNVANLAVSTQIKTELAQASDDVIAKPQILSPTADNRAITSYAVKAGDNVNTVAAQTGLSKETIKWANNLTSDDLSEGASLRILPLDGIVYKVKSDDTIQSIAEKYKADTQRVTTYNDLEQGGLTPGLEIIIPSGVLPNTERPGYVAPRPVVTNYYANYNFYGSGNGDVTFLYRNSAQTSDGNKNAWGNCTWYAWERRAQLGGNYRLPSSALGNAEAWAYSLSSYGYRVNNTPAPGAIMQNRGGLGHVAVVESVGENGDVTVTEMNYGGWYNGVDRRVISAGQAGLYNYIHERM